MNSLSEEKIYCPYCGEPIVVLIDNSEEYQDYIEDCQVCCRPIEFYVTSQPEGPDIRVQRDDD